MLVLISPAKVLNFSDKAPTDLCSNPRFIDKAEELIQLLRTYSINELSELFKVNINIAEENAKRYLQWQIPHTLPNAKQAIFAYDGAVFRGISAGTFCQEDLAYAQEHFRILSGLYGILRPLDMIMPYRLDVSTKLLNNEQHKDLYTFWRKTVTDEVNKITDELDKDTCIVNLMSKEYFKTLDKKKIKNRIITVDFLQYQADTDKFKSIVIYTKQGRGMMTRFILKNRITQPEELKLFTDGGYEYSHEFSEEDHFVFFR